MRVEQIVEAVLFASDAPLRADEIARADEGLDEDVVEGAIRVLQQFYLETERAYDLVEVAEGYQLFTRSEYASYLERFDTVPKPPRLSGAALETLAIIAYRQPIGRLEVEYVRGVGSSGVIRTLQDRGLIEVVGRAEGLGRPLLYGTTRRFLEHFGFQSLDDLPRPDELPVVLRDRSMAIIPEEDGEVVDPAQQDLPLNGEGATEAERAAERRGVAGGKEAAEGEGAAAREGAAEEEGAADEAEPE